MDPLDRNIAEAQSNLDSAKRHELACSRVLQSAQEDQARTQERLFAAERDVQAASTALSEAQSAYTDDPSDSNARRIAKCREVHELAQLRARKPAENADAAANSVSAATAAVEQANAEVARAEEALLVSEDFKTTDVDALHTDLAPLLDELQAALGMAQAAADAASARFAAANEACERLRLKGHDLARLAHYHICAPLLAEMVKSTPGLAVPILDLLGDPITTLYVAPQKIVVTSNLDPFLSGMSAAVPHPMDLSEEFYGFLGRRTFAPQEGRRLINAKQAEQSRAETERRNDRPAVVVSLEEKRSKPTQLNAYEQLDVTQSGLSRSAS